MVQESVAQPHIVGLFCCAEQELCKNACMHNYMHMLQDIKNGALDTTYRCAGMILKTLKLSGFVCDVDSSLSITSKGEKALEKWGANQL